jgi:NhaP-type Na+/H+ or K+/H+ antiporter
VLSSSVVTNLRVPRVVRHSLNLESGLNDGLALPAVLAFTAALVGTDHFVWWRFVLQDVGLGFAYGVVMGLLASLAVPRRNHSLYGLGVAFTTYGLTVLPPEGNGLIAVFTCAIVLGIRRPEVRDAFERDAHDVVEIVKLGIFVVFGSLLTFDGLFGDGWAAIAIVASTLLVARPIAIWIALAGTRLSAAVKAFMAWFGPKGVATMTFSLLVLSAGFAGDERIFNLAALCVFVSILAHGLTDTPGSEWIARREAPPAPARSGTPTPPGGDAPGGTRSAAGSEAAGRPDGSA